MVETDRSQQADNLTQAGTVLGTFAYMPPEQARGEVTHLDRRCDVFGLGAILYEILTGKPPYEGSREEVKLHAQLGFTQPALGRLETCHCGRRADRAGSVLSERHGLPIVRRTRALVAAEVAAYLAAVQERLRKAEVEVRGHRRTRGGGEGHRGGAGPRGGGEGHRGGGATGSPAGAAAGGGFWWWGLRPSGTRRGCRGRGREPS